MKQGKLQESEFDFRVPENYIERELEKDIEKYLDSPEILAVVGPRQCGKSTLLHHLLNKLQKKKKNIRINRISFDNQLILNMFENDVESFIEQHVKNFDFIFIDEIQYSKDSGRKLKYIYDSLRKKILISSSSSVDISIHSLKYLVGRIFLFNLYPLSFGEFLRHRDNSLCNLWEKNKYGEEVLEQLNSIYKEYSIYGGYPRVVLSNDKEEKRKVLDNIFNTFILREVKDLFGLSDGDKFIKLLKGLSLQTGSLIDYNELTNLTGFNSDSVRRSLKILEDSFICCRVKPYFKNKRVELYKTPKIYFYDNGFRNFSSGSFEGLSPGVLNENFIFSELVKKEFTINFWRTKSKAEVDFVVEKGIEIVPIEIKSLWNNKKITRSFSSFLEKYSPKKGYFLSEFFEGKRKEKEVDINFLPFVKFVSNFK